MTFGMDAAILIIALLLIIFLIWRFSKAAEADMKKTNGTFAKFFNRHLAHTWSIYILAGLVFVCIAEGFFAAFGVPANHNAEMPPYLRMIAHTSVAFISIFIAIGFGQVTIQQINNAVELAFDKKARKIVKKWAALIYGGFVWIFLFICVIMIPYLNVSIVAFGLNKMTEYNYIFQEGIINNIPILGNEWFFGVDMIEHYYMPMFEIRYPDLASMKVLYPDLTAKEFRDLNLGYNNEIIKMSYAYNPAAGFGTYFYGSIVSIKLHYLIAVADALIIGWDMILKDASLDQKKKERGTYDPDKDITKRDKERIEELKTEIIDDPEAMIKNLLRTLPAYSSMNAAKLEEEVEEYFDIFINELSDTQRTDVTGRMAVLWNAWDNIIKNKGKLGKTELLRLKKSKYSEIQTMFKSKYSDQGFGRQPKG